jgi:hypothetical protein
MESRSRSGGACSDREVRDGESEEASPVGRFARPRGCLPQAAWNPRRLGDASRRRGLPAPRSDRLCEALLATAELYDIPEGIAGRIEDATCAVVTLVEDRR